MRKPSYTFNCCKKLCHCVKSSRPKGPFLSALRSRDNIVTRGPFLRILITFKFVHGYIPVDSVLNFARKIISLNATLQSPERILFLKKMRKDASLFQSISFEADETTCTVKLSRLGDILLKSKANELVVWLPASLNGYVGGLRVGILFVLYTSSVKVCL